MSMPRTKTFDPFKLKTGDKVFFFALNDNYQANGTQFSSIKINARLVSAKVTEKLESLVPAGLDKMTRNFKFVLKVDKESPLGGNVETLIVNEQACMFLKSADAMSYFMEELRTKQDSYKDHDERQEEYGLYKILNKVIA